MSDSWETSGWPAPDDEDEIRRREIEEMMRSERERYFRDEAVQQEYRDIIDRQIARAENEANPKPTRPGPFDEALARFQANRALAPEGQEDRADFDSPAKGPVQLASNNAAFIPAGPPLKTDDRFLSSRERLDADEALFGQISNGQPQQEKQERVHTVQTATPPQTGPDSVQSDRVPNERSSPDAAANEVDLQIKNRSEAKFKGTALEKYYDTVVKAAKREGIPPIVAFSVIAQETGNGQTVRGNNVGGVMRGRNQGVKREYKTLEEGIDASVRTIANNYKAAGGDLEKMRDTYAPIGAANDKNKRNRYWLPNVRWFIRYFEGLTPP
jgi:flagellum-specific peptidoglycan hydrolase FlgJ